MSSSQPTAHAKSSVPSWHGFKTRSLPEVPSWVEPLGRCGYIAKGVVYFIIGFLAFQLAIGAGGEISGSRDAIREIAQQPFGKILLGLVAIGLIGYTVWRFVQAAKDTEGAGDDTKGIFKRTGYVVSGVAYLSLGLFAGSLALGMGGSSGQVSSGQSGGTTSGLLDSTWGRALLGIVGAITIGVAVYFVYKAYKAKFMTKYNIAEMSESARKAALNAGRIGLSTRAVAFAIIGGFILSSALQGSSDGEIAGLSDALAAIAAQSYGKILIGITGFGLMCYAVHMFLMARYRIFNVNS